MESWMPYFVGVTALAFVVQAIALVIVALQLRRTAARVDQTLTDLNSRVTPILARVEVLVDDVSPRISGILADAAEVTRLARGQALKMDRVVTETMERVRLQLGHVDHMLTGALETVEEAGTRLKQSVWGPVTRATAIVRGLQSGLEFVRNTRRRRGEIAESRTESQDEGMFI